MKGTLKVRWVGGREASFEIPRGSRDVVCESGLGASSGSVKAVDCGLWAGS